MTILCEPDADTVARLVPYLGDDVHVVVTLTAAARALAQGSGARLVVIGPGIRLDNALEYAARLSRQTAGPDVVLLRDEVSAELVSRALHCGVHAVLPSTELQGLADAQRRVTTNGRSPEAPVAERGRRKGTVVAVLAAKGGSGKTTLAINLALTLNANGTQRVCLLDLDLEVGDVARSLHIEPRHTLTDIAATRDPLTPEAVSSVVTPLGSALGLVLAPVGPGEAERVPPELVGELIAALAATYDYIVIDTPSRLPLHTLTVLDNADHHVLLTVPELPALQSLRLTLDMLDLLGYRREARSIVVNRTDSRVLLAAEDVERLLHCSIAGHVPFSWDVPASINRGVPIVVTAPAHPVSKAVSALARDRITTEGRSRTRPPSPRRSVRGWST